MLVIGLLLLSTWAAVLGWRDHQLTAAVEALSAAERQRVYADTLEELRSVCTTEPRLREHCRGEAELILRFSECDDACRTLAHRFAVHSER
jgi:hypothetical protein